MRKVSVLLALLPGCGAIPPPSDAGMPAALPGRYYKGDGLGDNCVITIRADGRFTFAWDG